MPAAVIVAHDDPARLRRLIAALDPLPVFLHVDANTPSETFAAMTADLPTRVRLLGRRPSGWAHPAVVEAEYDGYAAALTETDASHILVLTASCYPLRSVPGLMRYLDACRGKSLAQLEPFPYRAWGPLGGYDRILLPQRAAEDRRRRVSGPPRLVPRGLRPAGGAQQRIIARRHAERLLDVWRKRPDIRHFLLTSWAPDEVTTPTLLNSPVTGIDWAHDHVGNGAWFTDWGDGARPNPFMLTDAHWPRLYAAATAAEPALFARKFGPDSDGLADRIDAELRR